MDLLELKKQKKLDNRLKNWKNSSTINRHLLTKFLL